MPGCICPSYFKFHVRWLRLLTRITYLSKLIGIPSLAALFGPMASPLRGQRKRCSKTPCRFCPETRII
ncbi:hypothetical protein BV924_00165 [Pectobacterium odoriferum]|uniref:Uncharacterized protein n=1 Tax=Pectobacterium odoriferum TaxID=78398 RepID=A0ABD6VU41_9GAMM|nr:hypothetical protein BVY06_07830 [Pectobacterium odoriferum]POE02364.1 hypothetical protein BVY05_05975 [Pectobacterium odoriferum]POE05542.1 hypothetical protein BV916_08670 [Pectobacterium odoriferum]POE15233.1 hypothetical protein BV924_00165 [Pectobacterium odoriferum]POE19311.1 hypothetical protein BV918_03675 [Pectobacterium odoriferum]